MVSSVPADVDTLPEPSTRVWWCPACHRIAEGDVTDGNHNTCGTPCDRTDVQRAFTDEVRSRWLGAAFTGPGGNPAEREHEVLGAAWQVTSKLLKSGVRLPTAAPEPVDAACLYTRGGRATNEDVASVKQFADYLRAAHTANDRQVVRIAFTASKLISAGLVPAGEIADTTWDGLTPPQREHLLRTARTWLIVCHMAGLITPNT